MVAAGHAFFVSQNGVWLTDHVPPAFIDFPSPPSPRAHKPAPPALVGAGSRSRGDCVRIARTTLAACDAGFYARAGQRIELAAAIADAKAGTRLYDLADGEPTPTPTPAPAPTPPTPTPTAPTPTAIEVTGESTVAALCRLAPTSRHLACLNFASAKHPGGGFLGGARAQEESIARASALYPCLVTQPSHYERNRALRSPVYLDLAIWSPRVPVFRDDDGGWLARPVPASIITCAAPNAGAAKASTPAAEIEAALARRARLVLAIARLHEVDTLVLGAWGAGVFRNDPATVARSFRALLAGDFAHAFARVVFAVLGTSETSENHRAFVDAFA
jgi:uncharacterized protein (TIGR02452 family)